MVITAGPTREPIDPVRFISNYSTGYMGAQVAREASRRGHRVTVICGPISEPVPASARVIPVEQAQEMDRALRREARSADVIIMAAAVADYRPVNVTAGKLKRKGRLTLRLQATPDLIGRLPRRAGQLVVGFALETDQVVAQAAAKLREKRLDLVLAQQATASAKPFGRREVQAWLVEPGGSVTRLGMRSKPQIAGVLLDKIEALWYGQNARRSSGGYAARFVHRSSVT